MKKGMCLICNIVTALVVIGALNWGLVGFFDMNLVTRFAGEMTTTTKAIYGAIGIAGIMKLISCFKDCPACKK